MDDFETPLPHLLLLRLDRLQLLLGLVAGHTLRHEGALVAGRRVFERLGLVSGHLLKGQTEIQCNRPALISTSYNQCRVHSIGNILVRACIHTYNARAYFLCQEDVPLTTLMAVILIYYPLPLCGNEQQRSYEKYPISMKWHKFMNE